MGLCPAYSPAVECAVDGTSQFDPNDYSDVPLYNIQAAAGAAGVPAITLRSWERRHGVPRPGRDAKGYRVYSERDLAVAHWLRERAQQGIAISRAVKMLRVLESNETYADPTAPLNFEHLRSQLINSIAGLDEHGVNLSVARGLMVASVEEVALDLVQPVLRDIGARWQAGNFSVTCEHVGSNLLRSHLMQLVRLSPPSIRDVTVVVGCAPGELHDIGALILALFLRRRGYHVIYTGANVERESFVADILRTRPAAVCLSASLVTSAESLVETFFRLRDLNSPFLGFGGRVYREHPELIEHTPGVYLGDDARVATQRFEAMIDRGLAAPISRWLPR